MQQSLLLVQVTVAPPQLARHLSSVEVVVPRQFGYAAQQPPFAYEAEQLSPDAHTRTPPSGRSWPASTPASSTPASSPASGVGPASPGPASGSGTPLSEPASSPASRVKPTQVPLVHRSPTPQTSQVALAPQASSVLPVRQVLPRKQPVQVFVVPAQKPS